MIECFPGIKYCSIVARKFGFWNIEPWYCTLIHTNKLHIKSHHHRSKVFLKLPPNYYWGLLLLILLTKIILLYITKERHRFKYIWQKFCWKRLPLPKKKIISIYWDDVPYVNSQSEDNDVTRQSVELATMSSSARRSA